MKARKLHRVPLSDAAMAVYKQMADRREGHSYSPEGGRANRSRRPAAGIERRLDCEHVTLHVFDRRSANGPPSAPITHSKFGRWPWRISVGTAVERRHTQRSDLFERRRKLMTDWSAFCDVGDIDDDAKIVPCDRLAAPAAQCQFGCAAAVEFPGF